MAESVVKPERSFTGFSLNLVIVKKGQVTEFYFKELHELPLDVRHTGCVLHDYVLDVGARGVGGHGPEEAGEVVADLSRVTASVSNCGGLPCKVRIVQDGFEVGIFSEVRCELEPPILECVKILLIC